MWKCWTKHLTEPAPYRSRSSSGVSPADQDPSGIHPSLRDSPPELPLEEAAPEEKGQAKADAPLAERMRPCRLEEFGGQAHLLGATRPLRRALESGKLHSMVLWGPPGSGKTTLARLAATGSGAAFLPIPAVLCGVREVRAAVQEATRRRQQGKGETLLFVDEVHRFNKAQQDAFLPHIENGTLLFIGATTENPSFELNNALLSRLRVYRLERLPLETLEDLLTRALRDPEQGLGQQGHQLLPEAREWLAQAADGDARRALNLLEQAAALMPPGSTIDKATAIRVSAGDVRYFDKRGDDFYDQISALHKSVRGSAPDAALYWLARMLDGGCDPLYLARRLVRIASEDIGNADPRALRLALDAWESQERLGSPEGELALGQAVLYLSCAPKSNAVYKAMGQATRDAVKQGSLPVPKHLRNAPTALMKDLQHGQGYRYAHDEPQAYAAGEQYFPRELGERRYYQPVPRGLEERIATRLEQLRKLDHLANKNHQPAPGSAPPQTARTKSTPPGDPPHSTADSVPDGKGENPPGKP